MRSAFRVVEPALLAIYAALAFQLAFPATAQQYFLATTLKATPAQFSLYYGATFAPWSYKVLFGFLSDALPIGGLNRTPYLATYATISALAFAVLGTAASTFGAVTAVGVVLQAALCGSEVIVDSIAVERVKRERHRGDVQTVCQLWRSVGSLLATVLSVVLLKAHALPYRAFWLVCAGCPVVTVLALRLLPRDARATPVPSPALPLLAPRHGPPSSPPSPAVPAGEQASDEPAFDSARTHRPLASAAEKLRSLPPPASFCEACARGVAYFTVLLRVVFVGDGDQPALWPAALFIFLVQVAPSPSNLVALYFIQSVRLPAWVSALLSCVGLSAAVLGAVLYKRYFTGTPLWRTLVLTSSLVLLSTASQVVLVTDAYRAIALPIEVLIALDSFVVRLCSTLAFMPIIVMAASSCPPGLEATAYAAILSILDAAASVSDVLASGIAAALHITTKDWSMLWLAILICAGLRFVPLALFAPFRQHLLAVADRPTNAGSEESDSGT